MSDNTQSDLQSAMTVPTVNTLATGKHRIHRMMRRAEMVRRKREAVKWLREAEVELDGTWRLYFWRRRQLRRDIAGLKREARQWQDTLGEWYDGKGDTTCP
jgi:hypothetical protein